MPGAVSLEVCLRRCARAAGAGPVPLWTQNRAPTRVRSNARGLTCVPGGMGRPSRATSPPRGPVDGADPDDASGVGAAGVPSCVPAGMPCPSGSVPVSRGGCGVCPRRPRARVPRGMALCPSRSRCRIPCGRRRVFLDSFSTRSSRPLPSHRDQRRQRTARCSTGRDAAERAAHHRARETAVADCGRSHQVIAGEGGGGRGQGADAQPPRLDGAECGAPTLACAGSPVQGDDRGELRPA